jgi:glycerate kinase
MSGSGDRLGHSRSVVAAPDSFKGTATSQVIAAAIAAATAGTGWRAELCPMSDGGEGFAEVLASLRPNNTGRWREKSVTGPLGSPVTAPWWFDPPEAVLESAAASGLVLAGGAAGNDPMAATSRGTGDLILAALGAGARQVLLGVGGSATTDGGEGAVEAIVAAGGLGDAEVLVACDVECPFVEAASRFGPQKGASAEQVVELRARLERCALDYERRFGVDVKAMPYAGAAGGLAGGLAAVGARLVSGFDVVAGRCLLEDRVGSAALVVTGEGRLDETSWTGKVVGGVVGLARRASVPVLVVAGSVDPVAARSSGEQVSVESLEDRFGATYAHGHAAEAVSRVVGDFLAAR